MQIWKVLLEGSHSNLFDLAMHLTGDGESLPRISHNVPFDIEAIYGVDGDDWKKVVTALRVDHELGKISNDFPLYYLTLDELEHDGSQTRLLLKGGTRLGEHKVAQWLGRDLSSIDIFHLSQALAMLPDKWALVLDSRRSL